jgi:hypothetical protein
LIVLSEFSAPPFLMYGLLPPAVEICEKGGLLEIGTADSG